MANTIASRICASTSNITMGNTNATYISGGSVGARTIDSYANKLDQMKEYIDFAFEALGIGIDFDQFVKMTDAEKKSKLREIKINKIIE